MSLIVVRPGVLTTVQNRGRPGYRRFGVPVGGAADLASFSLANALLGNPEDCAALELTLVGGSYRAEVALALALAGAPLPATVESATGQTRVWAIPGTRTLHAGETLILGGIPVGARCYLAVRGGWQTPVILGSRSSELPIRIGDQLPAGAGTTSTRWPSHEVLAGFGWPRDRAAPIRWVDGPDRGSTVLAGSYRVLPDSNRVGVRLEGASIDFPSDPNRVSRPVAPGAIQVAGGQPIILGVAGGTIGGYPHVGHVIAADLDRIGQLRPGDLIHFEQVAMAEARRLDRDQRHVRTAWQARMQVWAGV